MDVAMLGLTKHLVTLQLLGSSNGVGDLGSLVAGTEISAINSNKKRVPVISRQHCMRLVKSQFQH